MKGKKMESKDLQKDIEVLAHVHLRKEHSSTFRLASVQKLAAPRGPTYFFDTEKTADEAVYSFTVVLL